MPVPPLLADLAGWGWRLLLLVVIAYLALRTAEVLHLVVVPLAAALLLSALLAPAVDFLRRRGLPRPAATGVTVVGALAVLFAVLAWVVDRGVHETPALISQLSRAVNDLPIRSSTVSDWRTQLVNEIQVHRGSLTQGLLSGLLTGAEILTGALLTLLLTVIMLYDGDRMWRWSVSRFPATAQPRLQEAARHAYRRLSGWIRGTFLIATFHGVVVALTLAVLGVPLIAPLSILVFFGSFVPIVGSVMFGGVAVLITFASKGFTAVVVLIAVLLVDNQIETHVLQPFLVGRYVRLHPFVVALVITGGAVLAGLGGALLAVPLTAAVYAALTHLDPAPPRPARPMMRRPRPRKPDLADPGPGS